MNIRHLKLTAMLNCLEVENIGSINGAAQRLHLSQPTLSRNIRSLEEDLGLDLFRRMPNGVEPTVFGKTLLDHARVIQSELLRCVQDLKELQASGRASLQVGGTPTSVGRILTPVALELMKRTEDINVGLVEALPEELYVLLLRGTLNLFVATPPADQVDESVEVTRLFDDEIGIVVGARHPLARRRSVKIAALLDQRWVTPVKAGRWLEAIARQFSAAGVPFPTRLFQTNSYVALRQSLVDTDLIALAPLGLVGIDIEAGTLRRLRTDLSIAPATYHLYVRRQDPEPEAVTRFRTELLRSAAALRP